jgi:hypothetical protein
VVMGVSPQWARRRNGPILFEETHHLPVGSGRKRFTSG